MRLFGVERHSIIEDMALRSYECAGCDAIHTELVPLRSIKAPAAGLPPTATVYGLLAKSGFDDTTTGLLGAAFDMAWGKLEASGSPLAAEPFTASTRELLAQCVMVLGRRTGSDIGPLVEKALAFLAELKPGCVPSASVIRPGIPRRSKRPLA